MQITINTSEPLTAQERALIEALLTQPGHTIVTEPAPAKPAPAKPAPAKPAPAKPAPAPEPEVVEEPEEDLIGGEPTVQDAVDAATAFVNNGEQARVKAALKAVGVARVGALPPAKVQAFLDVLEG